MSSPMTPRSAAIPVAGAQGLQTNNPGWPGFESEGWVLVSALYFRVSI